MTENRSLDDFVGGERSDGAGGAGESNAEEADADETPETDAADVEAGDGRDADAANEADAADATPPSTDAVEPAVGTYRWTPDGVACAACGETVERLWSDDGEQVCETCKEW